MRHLMFLSSVCLFACLCSDFILACLDLFIMHRFFVLLYSENLILYSSSLYYYLWSLLWVDLILSPSDLLYCFQIDMMMFKFRRYCGDRNLWIITSYFKIYHLLFILWKLRFMLFVLHRWFSNSRLMIIYIRENSRTLSRNAQRLWSLILHIWKHWSEEQRRMKSLNTLKRQLLVFGIWLLLSFT